MPVSVTYLETGAYLTMDSGHVLQRISSEGKPFGFGEIVLHGFTELQVDANQFQPVIDQVGTTLLEQGIHGTVTVYVDHIDTPKKVTLR